MSAPVRYPLELMTKVRFSKKVAVFGSGGQVGVELVRELRSRGYQVAAWERSHIDITDAGRVERAIAEFDPQLVFNTAAYNMVDVAENEPQAAYAINGLAVRNLALACRQTDAQLIHFSTDYVFDGESERPYTEGDRPHPLGAYAVSKLAGELYARAYQDRCLILRTSGVFGPGAIRTPRGNFVELMLRLAGGTHPIRVVEDHTASPTFAPALAARAIDLAEAGQSGTFHLGGGQPITWFEYARMIFEAAGLNPPLQAANSHTYRTPVRRPRYCALSNAKAEAAGIAPMPLLRDALAEYMSLRKNYLVA